MFITIQQCAFRNENKSTAVVQTNTKTRPTKTKYLLFRSVHWIRAFYFLQHQQWEWSWPTDSTPIDVFAYQQVSEIELCWNMKRIEWNLENSDLSCVRVWERVRKKTLFSYENREKSHLFLARNSEAGEKANAWKKICTATTYFPHIHRQRAANKWTQKVQTKPNPKKHTAQQKKMCFAFRFTYLAHHHQQQQA